MQLLDAADVALCTVTMQENAASNRLRIRTGATGATNVDIGGSEIQSKWYLMIQRDATTNYIVFVSRDGITWYLGASFSQAGTVGRVRLLVNGQTTATTALFDFIRSFVGLTSIIGATPSGAPAVSAGWMQPLGSGDIMRRYRMNAALAASGGVGPLT